MNQSDFAKLHGVSRKTITAWKLPCEVKKKLALISGIQPPEHCQQAAKYQVPDTSRLGRANGVKRAYINTIIAISTHGYSGRMVYTALWQSFTGLRRVSSV